MGSNKDKPASHKTGTLIAATSYEGPLPMPEALAKYEEILPGAAERIMAMSERQAAHRQALEKGIYGARSRDSFFGVIFAFIIAMITVISGVYLSLQGQPLSGTILGSSGLVGLVSVFIYGTHQRRRDDRH